MAAALHLENEQHLVLLRLLVAAAAAIHYCTANCIPYCGSVHIPFPFGITKDCAFDTSFLIDCNNTNTASSNNSSSSIPFLPQSNLTVLNISLTGELRVSWPVASICYNAQGQLEQTSSSQQGPTKEHNLTQFRISSSRNKLISVGCDTVGVMVGYDLEGNKSYATGCVSYCNEISDTRNGQCNGVGCCESSFPGDGLSGLSYNSGTMFNHTLVASFNPCSYTFPAEDGAYNFVASDLNEFNSTKTIPVVLDWAVGNQTCQQARRNNNNDSSYACKANNSECRDSSHGHGYFCNCSAGFRGNPYISQGCKVNFFYCETTFFQPKQLTNFILTLLAQITLLIMCIFVNLAD